MKSRKNINVQSKPDNKEAKEKLTERDAKKLRNELNVKQFNNYRARPY